MNNKVFNWCTIWSFSTFLVDLHAARGVCQWRPGRAWLKVKGHVVLMTFTSLEFGSTRCFQSCSINPESIRRHSFQVRGQWPDLDISISSTWMVFSHQIWAHQFWPGKHWSDRYREPRRDFQERLKDAYAPLPGPELEAGGGNRSIGWLQPGVLKLCFFQAGAATSSPESQGETHTENFLKGRSVCTVCEGVIFFFPWPYSPVSVNWHLCHGYTIHTWYVYDVYIQPDVVSIHPQASTGEIPAARQVPLWHREVEVAWILRGGFPFCWGIHHLFVEEKRVYFQNMVRLFEYICFFLLVDLRCSNVVLDHLDNLLCAYIDLLLMLCPQ